MTLYKDLFGLSYDKVAAKFKGIINVGKKTISQQYIKHKVNGDDHK